MLSKTTRLRFVWHEKPEVIQAFCDTLGRRIEVYQLQWTGKAWYLWFVPPDNGSDLKSGKLKTKNEKEK